MTNDEAKDTILASHFKSNADMLSERLRPSLRIRTERLSNEAGHRASKFGGTPLVPDGFEWPHWNATQWLEEQLKFNRRMKEKARGTSSLWDESIVQYEARLDEPHFPLAFLGQLNLTEIHGGGLISDLPTEGWLLFFYDVENSPCGFDPSSRGSSLVQFIHNDRDLVLIEPPEELDEEHWFSACALKFELEHSLPRDMRTYGLDIHIYDNDDYRSLVESLVDPTEPLHRIGGYPEAVQNPMELECQLVTNGIYCGDSSGYDSARARSLAPGAAEWQLLMQLDSDDKPGWMWGDAGRIYYWNRESDTKTQNFDGAWCILQCY